MANFMLNKQKSFSKKNIDELDIRVDISTRITEDVTHGITEVLYDMTRKIEGNMLRGDKRWEKSQTKKNMKLMNL